MPVSADDALGDVELARLTRLAVVLEAVAAADTRVEAAHTALAHGGALILGTLRTGIGIADRRRGNGCARIDAHDPG